MRIEAKLEALGLKLPAPLIVPSGMQLPFPWVRVYGNRAFMSGHGPLNHDGTPVGPFGKLGAEVSVEEGYHAAHLVALSMLGNLKRALNDLDRVEAWLTVSGMVNVAPGFMQTTQVINGFSDLIIELYGAEAGHHARTAIGVAQLPLSCPVVIAAEVSISTESV